MTYRLSMSVRSPNGPRPVITNIAGCLDEEHAKEKAKELYNVIKFKSVELVKSAKEK